MLSQYTVELLWRCQNVSSATVAPEVDEVDVDELDDLDDGDEQSKRAGMAYLVVRTMPDDQIDW